MSEEFLDQLKIEFPKMYTDECYDFSIGDGWHNLIKVLSNYIQHHIDSYAKHRSMLLKSNPNGIEVPAEIEQVVVVTVKEKFGGLRFYYNGGDSYIGGLVSMAEAWANHTCEVCGEVGEVRYDGWIRTLCQKHADEHRQRQIELYGEEDA